MLKSLEIILKIIPRTFFFFRLAPHSFYSVES